MTGSTELSPVSVDCPASSTQLQLPVKLTTITGDVELTARLELNVSRRCAVCHCHYTSSSHLVTSVLRCCTLGTSETALGLHCSISARSLCCLGGHFECPLITGVNVKVAVYVFSCFLFLSSSLCRLNIKHYSCCA